MIHDKKDIWPGLIKVVYLCTFLLSVFMILAFFSQMQGWNLQYLFNADILYFPTLFKDLFIDEYKIQGWYIPGSPNFFPDMFLYFILMGLFKDPVISSSLYSILQFLLVMVLFNILIIRIFQKRDYALLSLVNLLFSLFVLVGFYCGSFLISFHVLSNTYHLGAFVNALIALIFSFSFLRSGKNSYLYYLFLIGFIAVLCDKLFMALYVVPFFLSLLPWIRRNNSLKIGKITAVIVLMSFFGIFSFNMLRNFGPFHMHPLHSDPSWEKIISSFHVLTEQMLGYILKWNLFSLILFGCLLYLGLAVFWLILKRKQIFYHDSFSDAKGLQNVYVLFSVLFMGIVFFTPVVLGDYPSGPKIRYIVFVFYLAMLGFVPLLYMISGHSSKMAVWIKYSSVVFLFILTAMGIRSVDNFEKGLKRYYGYYPEISRCMDDMKSKYPLKLGVSTYWNAKVGTMFSKEDVRLYTVFDSRMAPYKHVCNENWYYETGYGKYDPPVFNYVIFDKTESLASLYEKFGEVLVREDYGNFVFILLEDFTYSREQKYPVLSGSSDLSSKP